MKFLLVILIMLSCSSLTGFAANDAFDQAGRAYDEGRYAEAMQIYESMLSNGVANVEVHYNLANASFKAGNLPAAVWHYRKAWYEAPRDPEIRANLHFALGSAGAIDPAPSVVQRMLTTLSAREWTWVAIGSYLLLAALLILALLIRIARPVLLKLCLLPAAVLLMAAVGGWQWHGFRVDPEAVVVKAGTTALYGPVDGGTAYYKLPLGALVRQRATDPKGWVEIEYDGKRGWIKKNNILHLSPCLPSAY